MNRRAVITLLDYVASDISGFCPGWRGGIRVG
jgi:hypothetical protein